jgi:hypothetical protein
MSIEKMIYFKIGNLAYYATALTAATATTAATAAIVSTVQRL